MMLSHNEGQALLNGYQLEQTYQLALKFLREKEGKAFHLSYIEKSQLAALAKQVRFGPYQPQLEPDMGLLDVVGRNRTECWKKLGDISREDAQSAFIAKVEKICPQFVAVVEAHFCKADDHIRKDDHSSPGDRHSLQHETDVQATIASESDIRAILKTQTFDQFSRYAQEQFPDDISKQEQLVQMLQEQHFQQYMNQLYEQQQLQRTKNLSSQESPHKTGDGQYCVTPSHSLSSVASTTTQTSDIQHSGDPVNRSPEYANGLSQNIGAATMWTRKDIEIFKASLKENPEGILQIGSGEIVTIRVPTHHDGSSLFWEFATDLYDIGFGLFFERDATQGAKQEAILEVESRQTLNEGSTPSQVVENTQSANTPSAQEASKELEIIPVFRRECQKEIYCGSHPYPCQGVYLLRFDNSYSLWRTKVLYYRVYYSR